MLEVILKGHDKYYGVSDVVRMFAGVPEELKDEGKVIAPEGPDVTLVNELMSDGRSVTFLGDKEYGFKGELLEPGREIKRSLYMALSDITSKRMPWGCLTGIRPTLVACEEDSPDALEEKYFVRPDKALLAYETSREELRLLEKVPEDNLCVYPVVLSPAAYTYLDLAYNESPNEIGLHWAGYVDEHKTFALEPKNYKGEIIGVQAQLWSSQLRSFSDVTYQMLPKALGVAERGWNAETDGFSEDAFGHFYGIIVAREMPVWEKKGYVFKKSALP